MKNEMPIGLGLIVCDNVIEDVHTRKKSLIGIYDRIVVERMPVLIPCISVLVALNSGRGKYKCELKCEAPNMKKNFSGKGDIEMKNPIHTVEIHFNFMNIEFEMEGIHNLTFLVDDFPLMSRSIFVDIAKKR